VSIDKQGRWQCHDLRRIEGANTESLPIPTDSPAIRLEPQGERTAILPADSTAPAIAPVDVVFPVIHGPLCEDGAMQGLLELAGAAYVGSGVLASAVGMHKDIAKRLAALAGLPVAPYLALSRRDWRRDPQARPRRPRGGSRSPSSSSPATWAPASASIRSRAGRRSTPRSPTPSSTTPRS
jgi:D-alanine-D-alanine ligase